MPSVIDKITELLEGLKFWELTQMALAVVQMLIYLDLMDKYEEGLREIGKTLFDCDEKYDPENCNDLKSLTLKHRCRYFEFRRADQRFDEFYRFGVPEYSICERNVDGNPRYKVDITRGKGKAYEVLGSVFRKVNMANNGYTPLAMVGAVARNTTHLLKTTGSVRALNHIAEQKRKVADELLHWAAIVAIPVEREGDYAGFKVPIEAYETSMQNYAQGVNSAGIMFGRALYGFLDSGNKNQTNYGPIPLGVSTANIRGSQSSPMYGIGGRLID